MGVAAKNPPFLASRVELFDQLFRSKTAFFRGERLRLDRLFESMHSTEKNCVPYFFSDAFLYLFPVLKGTRIYDSRRSSKIGAAAGKRGPKDVYPPCKDLENIRLENPT